MSSGDIGQHRGSFFVDGQRLQAKQRSADAAEEDRENDSAWEFGLWRSANSYMFPVSGRTADWPVDGILDKWMYARDEKKGRQKAQLCSQAGACKVQTSSWDWVWLVQCTPLFICFHNAWRSISRQFLSWAGSSPSPCLANVSSFHPADEQHKHIWLRVGQGFLWGVCSCKHKL